LDGFAKQHQTSERFIIKHFHNIIEFKFIYMYCKGECNTPLENFMVPTQITQKFQISAQPKISDFSLLFDQGITLIINDRPDGEDSEQPGSQSEAEAASRFGMNYRHIPVTAVTLSEADIRTFQTAVSEASGPVLAHCKSGTRSLTLFVLGEVLDGRMAPTAIMEFGKRCGFDLTSAALWLSNRYEKGTG
jgi:uncharacterized protein (TIGR01244 family)